jgi:chromatin structure-remodeling complex subunit RSC9
MQQVFEPVPHAEMTQVDFWNLYKVAFSPYGLDNMLPATDLIKLVTTIFPQANAMVLPGTNGKPPKFVIRGLERRRASADNRTKCQWDRWNCEEPSFASPSLLYAHVKSHTTLVPTTKCLWGSCTHESKTTELFDAHLLTHLPVQIHGTRHPGQADDLIVPIQSEAYAGMPTARPVPPPPQQPMVYQKAIEDPPSTSFTALLIMRILYRTSFVQAEVVMKTDGNHFGFPGIEQPAGEAEAETNGGVVIEDLGFDTLEGQRRGKAAFKAIAGMLGGVYIHDPAIAAWIDEILDSIKSLPNSV